jgi:hypothetical protein
LSIDRDMDTQLPKLEIAHLSLDEFGEVIIMARNAVILAYEDAKARQWIKNKNDMAVIIYTDDPSVAGAFYTLPDFEDLLSITQVVNIAIIMGENFPPDSFEALRNHNDAPRIAALYMPTHGTKCPRCRKHYEVVTADNLCQRCDSVVKDLDAKVFAQ